MDNYVQWRLTVTQKSSSLMLVIYVISFNIPNGLLPERLLCPPNKPIFTLCERQKKQTTYRRMLLTIWPPFCGYSLAHTHSPVESRRKIREESRSFHYFHADSFSRPCWRMFVLCTGEVMGLLLMNPPHSSILNTQFLVNPKIYIYWHLRLRLWVNSRAEKMEVRQCIFTDGLNRTRIWVVRSWVPPA